MVIGRGHWKSMGLQLSHWGEAWESRSWVPSAKHAPCSHGASPGLKGNLSDAMSTLCAMWFLFLHLYSGSSFFRAHWAAFPGKKLREGKLMKWRASLVAQMVKSLPAVQETWVWSLSWEAPLEKGLGPLQCCCLENSMDRAAWWAAVHRGCKESDRTEVGEHTR